MILPVIHPPVFKPTLYKTNNGILLLETENYCKLRTRNWKTAKLKIRKRETAPKIMNTKALVILLLLSWFDKCLLLSSNPGSNPRNKSERAVIYPTSNEPEHSLPIFPDPVVAYVGRQQPMAPPVDKYGRPLCAKDPKDTFCERVDNYPDTEIRKAINYTSEEFVELFGTMAISSRKSGDVDEDTVCPQNSKLFYPKAAVNENDHWAYVVNDVDYVQTVMAEICQGDGEQPCRYLDGALPSGVSSRCRQKYAYKRLLALHPNQKRTYTDAFRFPSCCVCYVKKPFVMSRTRHIDVEDVNKAPATSRRNPRPLRTDA